MSKEEQRKVPVLRFKGFTDDWEQRKLKDEYQKISNAFVGTASPFYVEHGHFYLESNNIKNGQINHDHEVFINDTFYNEQRNKHLHTNDLVMVQSGHVGDSAVITKRYNNIAAHALIMFQNPKYSETSRFLNYYFQSYNAKKKISVISIGNTISHILASDMNKFITSFPKSSEQQKIATIFQRIQDLISLQQRKQKLNTILRHNLLNTLISYDKVNNQCKIKTFAKVISKTINPQNFPNDKFQEYSMPAFDKNKKPDIVLGNTMHSNKFKISQPTILFNKLNVRKNRIWNITESQNNDICSTEFIPLTTKSINKNYLYFALQTDYILYHVISLSTGSSNSQKRITPNDLLNLTIPIPSQEKQEEISHILNALDKKIHGNNIKIKQLKKLKKFMLEKLFI